MRTWFPAGAALAGLSISVVSPVGPQAAPRPATAFDARAVGDSLVLLKNERRTLPLSKAAGRIHVAGRGAEEILAGLRAAVASASQVTYAEDGSGAAGAEAGVVVIGETPYEERDAIATMKRAGVPVVLVVVSGRPFILGDLADTADAIVVGRLPGADGPLVADVLFGHVKPSHAYGHGLAY